VSEPCESICGSPEFEEFDHDPSQLKWMLETERGDWAVHTLLKGVGRAVTIEGEGRFTLIGQRINPSGRRKLAADLARGDMALVRQEALAQVEAGAGIIDINVSAAGVDEVTILALAVQTVAEGVDVPICIDTADREALVAALRICPGKPLVNSVTGEQTSLEGVLPLVRESGSAVIGLCMDEEGIPKEAQGRFEIAERIVRATEGCGIPREDVIIDPLATAVGLDQQAAAVTLDAIHLIRMKLGVNITVGGGNISFGLPERSLIERSFLAMAIAAGLSCAFLDPLDVEIRKTIAACDLLMGRDEFAMQFLGHWREGW